ncbi:MAG: BrnT family toxin [Burkholderiales bacterium]|jgi:uncharacterized DUF497 family protein|nr:BrnT family toxin [Burkholderiales bacterium]MBP9769015.1 BrnT family toxin [Burkholderiales bacterium]
MKNKIIKWNEEKNAKLKAERGISFEMILSLIEDGNILDIRDNSNYPNQKYLFCVVGNYVCCVPFVETDSEIFLKTIFPSRKFNKLLNGGDENA